MPLAYDDEQLSFVESVRDALGRHCSMQTVREVVADPSRWTEIWDTIVSLDLPALLVPEDVGGLGLSPVEMVAILEAAGRFAAPVPLTMTIGAFTPVVVAAGGDDESARRILREVVNGATGSVAPTISCPFAPSAKAILRGSELDLRCDAIPEASRAGLIAIPALRDGQDGRPVLVVASPAQLGISIVPGMDLTSPVGVVYQTTIDMTTATILEGDARPAIPVAWAAAAAELVGLAAELVDLSVRHARDRVQFGQPIGAFQAVKHRLVDAHLAVERGRSLTLYAALLAAEGSVAATPAAHRAKAAASEAANTAARAAVQVHGGLGITVEHDVSLLYLRARQLSAVLGTADEHYACGCNG